MKGDLRGRDSFWGWHSIIVLLGLWFSMPSMHAANVDSLRKVAAALPMDTSSVISLVKMCQTLRGEGHEEAEQFAERAVTMAQQLGQPHYIGEAMLCLGLVHGFHNDYDRAMQCYLEAEKNYRIEDYEPGIARCNLNMAAGYLARLNYDLAEKHLLIAQDIIERLHLDKYRVSANTNLAIIYTEKGAYAKAEQLHLASLKFLADGHNILQRSVCYTNLGFLYERQQLHAQAYEYYKKAYETAIVDGGGLYYEGGYALLNMINTLVESGRPKEAAEFLKELWPISEKSGSPLLMAETYRTAAGVHAQIGQHAKAYEELNKFIAIDDSLKNADMNSRIATVQKEYDIRKRDETIARMEREQVLVQAAHDEQAASSRRMFWLLIGLGVLGLLLFVALAVTVSVYLSRSRVLSHLRESHRLIQEQKAAIEFQNATLKLHNERLEDLRREQEGLVGIVAHDLKSPMNKALALSELLKLQGPLNEAQIRSVEMMGKVASAGNDLIRDLLDLNAVEHPEAALQPEAIVPGTVLQDIAAGFAGEAQRKGITLNVVTPSDPLPAMWCDRKALARVMDNLVSNALKFSPQGRQVQVAAVKDGKFVRLEVTDQGPGISAEDQEKLFKKFQRLSARPTGGESSTGLGLAIAQALVQKLGGNIGVQSRLGEGATFFVRIPVQSAG